MKKLIVEAEISIDGAMGGESADFWQQVFPFHTSDVTEYLNDLLFLPDALLMGRDTYEFFKMVWPAREGADADRINAMPKYVASRTLEGPLEWESTLLTGDLADAVRKIKEEPGTALLQYGVGELTAALFEHGLVDELRLIVYPFSFGAGPRILDRMGVHTFELLETKTFSSGALALHYRPR